jgi:hypothetical protein
MFTKITLIVFCLFVSSVFGASAKPQTFNDVPPSHPYYGDIEQCASRGVVVGDPDGSYHPDAPLLRASAAVVIERAAFGVFEPPAYTGEYFDDVHSYHYFAGFIEDFAERGITNGCGTRLFCPFENITRGQIAVFIVRAIGEFNPSPPAPGTFRFLDVPESHPFYAFIHRLRELGVTNGCSEFNFCPEDTITRGQAAAFLVRAFIAP